MQPLGRSDRPSMCAGAGRPKSSSTVGAMSMIEGDESRSSLRLENRTPGTHGGSMQWSPLQHLMLSLKTVRADALARDARPRRPDSPGCSR